MTTHTSDSPDHGSGKDVAALLVSTTTSPRAVRVHRRDGSLLPDVRRRLGTGKLLIVDLSPTVDAWVPDHGLDLAAAVDTGTGLDGVRVALLTGKRDDTGQARSLHARDLHDLRALLVRAGLLCGTGPADGPDGAR